MLAKELLSDMLPVLGEDDTGVKALSWMEFFKVSHLPVISDGNLLSVISDNDITDLQIGENTIKGFQLPKYKPFVYQNQHIYEIIEIVSNFKLTTIPVLDNNNKFAGTITVHELTNYLAKLLAVKEQGSIIELEMDYIDYSATQICNIVENENLKILSLYVNSVEESARIKVTLKLNSNDISSVIDTFERYEYNISSTFLHNDKNEDIYNERYDILLNYINL